MAISIRTAGAGVLLVAGVVVGSLGVHLASAGSSASSGTKAPVYAVNANGQTYGSALDATSRETEPDLVEAYGVDGTRGYVRAADLHGPEFTSPDAALAFQKVQQLLGERHIALYAVDGITVIGTFALDTSADN